MAIDSSRSGIENIGGKQNQSTETSGNAVETKTKNDKVLLPPPMEPVVSSKTKRTKTDENAPARIVNRRQTRSVDKHETGQQHQVS